MEEEINNDIMRYELDNDGYILNVYFGCTSGTCIEYTGTIPEGYESLEDWVSNANIRAYKIVNGNLVYDENRDNELNALYEIQAEENEPATHEWVRSQLGKSSSVVVDEFSNNKTGLGLIVLDDSGDYEIPNLEVSSETINSTYIVVSNKNILGNTAINETINGISFVVNADKSITLNGTATANIELDLIGNSTNTDMLFLIKENTNYSKSGLAENVGLSLYSFDGTDRTLVDSGGNKTITLNSSSIITQAVLTIESGSVFNDVTIYPQIEIGTETEYLKHEENKTTISLTDGLGSTEELKSYYPTTVIMSDSNINISVDYFKHKYLESKFAEIKVTEDGIIASVDKLCDSTTVSKTATSNPIEVSDAGEYNLESIGIDGKSYQDGTPTPTAPVEIKTVKGIENLALDKIQYNNLVINTNGSITSDSLAFIATSKCEKGKYYIVNNTSGNRCKIGFTSEEPKAGMNVSDLLLIDNDSPDKYKDVVVYSNIDGYINIYYYYGSDTSAKNNAFNNLLIGKYGRWLEQITHGKNKLNLSSLSGISGTKNGLTYSIDSNGIITLNGTCTSGFSIAKIKPNININNGKYKYHILNGSISNGDFSLVNNVDGANKYLTNNKTFITISGNLTNIDFYANTGIVCDNAKIGISLVEDEELDNFEPYKENTALIDMNIYDEEGNIVDYYEFAETNDIKDTFKDGELNKRIGKVVLTGNENFVKSNLAFQYQTTYTSDLGDRTIALCTHYMSKYYESGITTNIGNNEIGFNANKFMTIRDDRYTTATEFKAFLKEQYDAGTPVEIYYVLAEPQTYQLSYEPLKLFKGYNYITLNDGLNPSMNIEYLTDVAMNETYATRGELKVESNNISLEVSKKVSKDEYTKAEIVTKINDNTSNVTINADTIDQDGLATFMNSRLSTAGKTTINGGNITTGNINCNRLNGGTINGQAISGGTITGTAIKGSEFKGTTAGVKLRIGTDSNGDNYSNNSLELVRESDNALMLSVFGKFWDTNSKVIYFRSPSNRFVFMDGNVTVSTLTQTSLEEKKKNFEKLDNGLDIIKNTDIYKYHLDNQEDSEKKHIGFVIGDNYKYAHEITAIDGEQNEVGVDLYSMVSVCFKAIQEQQKQIDDLTSRIEKLENK